LSLMSAFFLDENAGRLIMHQGMIDRK